MSRYDFYQVKQGICHLRGEKDNGYIVFTQFPNKTVIQMRLHDLPPGKHGIHIHQTGDMRQGCTSLGSHYNPFNKDHGGLNSGGLNGGGHLGDLGNIDVDKTGHCNEELIAAYLPLSGQYSIIGRSIVIHSQEDDLGLGNNEESKKTGNSGERISCGVIGHM